MNDVELMHVIDEQVAHIWMVRTFLKHSDEVTDDEELAEVHRDLYDFAHALGGPYDSNDAHQYLHLARKKLSKLRNASLLFTEIQPEVSGHMNYRMAARSLNAAVTKIQALLTT
jgi:cob(I)alamin adenosyltransferase